MCCILCILNICSPSFNGFQDKWRKKTKFDSSQHKLLCQLPLQKKLILISVWCLSSPVLHPPCFWIPTKVSDSGRGRGLSWDLKIFDKGLKVCSELKVTCRPILHSSGCFSRGKQCVLCAVSLGRPIISLLPAGSDLHMGRRTRPSLCVPVWRAARCVLDLGEGGDASARLTSVILPFNAHALRNLTSCGHFAFFFFLQNRKLISKTSTPSQTVRACDLTMLLAWFVSLYLLRNNETQSVFNTGVLVHWYTECIWSITCVFYSCCIQEACKYNI